MTLIDTHTHLYVDQFADDRDSVVKRAKNVGITRMYLPNIDVGSIDAMLALEESDPQACIAMMGLHPCSVADDYEAQLAVIRQWLDRRPFAAIGEIGMDLYWDKTHEEEQKKAFLTQVEWALEFDYPIVIHSRETTDQLISLIQEVGDANLRGIFHCFTGSVAQAEQIMDLGFYMGLGGVLTFKNSGLDKTVAGLPLERMVLETDSPYLAPVPHRGKRNESSYILNVAEKLAEVYGISLGEVAEQTTKNANSLFGLSNPAYETGQNRLAADRSVST